MNRIVDMSGMRFGRLTVVSLVPNKNNEHGARWLCRCDCGNEVVVTRQHLRRNQTLSCGCYRKDNAKAMHTTHGQKDTRLYRIWAGMKDRTTNPKSKYWKNYGGIGIKICDEWLKFENFYEWSKEHGYEDNLTIDRVDNSGNYEPDNCRWVDYKEQENNRSNTRFCLYNGEKIPVGKLKDILGISRDKCLSLYGI